MTGIAQVGINLCFMTGMNQVEKSSGFMTAIDKVGISLCFMTGMERVTTSSYS